MFFVVDNWFSINDETMTIALENSNMPLSRYCLNHDCSDCKIMELMTSLRFGPRFLWKMQPTLILIVCPQAPPPLELT